MRFHPLKCVSKLRPPDADISYMHTNPEDQNEQKRLDKALCVQYSTSLELSKLKQWTPY